jgi:hypothetical protein
MGTPQQQARQGQQQEGSNGQPSAPASLAVLQGLSWGSLTRLQQWLLLLQTKVAGLRQPHQQTLRLRVQCWVC